MIKIAAAGFMCIDYWPQFDDRYYVTGNGVDVLFNLLDMRNDIAPSVVSVIGDDEYGKKAVAVEVNAETDFVAKNDKFQGYVKQVAEQALETNFYVTKDLRTGIITIQEKQTQWNGYAQTMTEHP